jgi:hypothetical protein
VLSELDMMVGKILCYLYLSPERLAKKYLHQQELYDELMALADEAKLLKLVNNRSPVRFGSPKITGKSAFLPEPPASSGHGLVYGPRQQQVSYYRVCVPLRRGCALW